MDDSPELERKNIDSKSVKEDEIDPLDAYMLEIDQQVQTLDENDKIKENEVKQQVQDVLLDTATNLNNDNIDNLEADEEDEETIGKAGNFATVEELIA